MSIARQMMMAAASGAGAPTSFQGWGGYQGSFVGPALTAFSTETDFGDTFGGAYYVAFNPDGSKGYVGTFGDTINQWSLPSPYTFTGATLDGSLNDGGFGLGIFFSPDGDKLIYSQYSPEGFVSFDLTTPFDVRTKTNRLEVTATGNASSAISPDGLYLFKTDRNNTIYRYVMSSPGDISTLTLDYSDALGAGPWYGIAFAGDGLSVYLGNRGDDIVRYDLTTAYDTRTAVNPTSFTFSDPAVDTYALSFTNLGQRLWIGEGQSADGGVILLEQ